MLDIAYLIEYFISLGECEKIRYLISSTPVPRINILRRAEQIDAILSILQELRASEMAELEKSKTEGLAMGNATISLSFEDGLRNEHTRSL